MTDNTQPEALRLAEQYDHGDPATHGNAWKAAICAELRRQHARIAELESELEAVGAGGVQALSAAPEIHEPKCPALDGAGCTCAKPDPTIDRAWAQFCGGIGDGLDAPYPGMISAFERYYSQSFADKAWRNEASVWAAAWKAALLAASPTPPAEQQAPRCSYCDGTGDVHSGDGEWRGICTECEAGTALHQQAAPKAAPGEPPGIQALMCVISSLRDTAHFSDEGGELTNDLRTLRDWAYAQTAAFQPSPTAQAAN